MPTAVRAGRCFGWRLAAKVSMIIMRPPQHWQGRGSMRGSSSAVVSDVSTGFERDGIEATEDAAERTVPPMVLVLMGVSGSGKSTVALELHRVLGWRFQEGDDLHPPSNIEKMRSGRPLDDADRMPWLQAVARWIDERLSAHEPGIITVPTSSAPTGRSQSAPGRGSASSF
jgi:hypothetical protein